MSHTTATVYSTPGCVQCTATYRALDKIGASSVVVDLADETNAAAREWVTEDLGYSQAPIVVIDENQHWSGYRPDRIATLATTA
ncbi:glutaredoxin domain-containing protein [Cellulomonas sp. 179-A 9B4 NHS]|uniref:glutaredoxin domain-containing protein n=1 Tax=Cellulomonas sp. 179-A 9B4 NHS TaxID=3142379 RepID=UPI0039A090E7